MTVINSEMKNAQLVSILADEFGVEAPKRVTKDELLALLAEHGATITGDAPTTKKTVKKGVYVINILKEKDNKGPVLGGLNGKAFVLPRGQDTEVSEAIYEILTKGAMQIIGEAIDGGGMETYSRPAYPVTTISRPA